MLMKMGNKKIKIEFEIDKEELKKKVVEQIAKEMLDESNSKSFFGSSRYNIKEVMVKKAEELLKTDKKIDAQLKKEIKKQLSNKRLIREVARDEIEDKMNRIDD